MNIFGPAAQPRNLLLASLPREDLIYLQPRLERVPLREGDMIVRQHDPILFIHFPEAGVTSAADTLPDGRRVEVALIGHEGMTNSELLLGCREAPQETSVRIGGGTSLRLPAEELMKLCARSPSAAALFLRFIHAVGVQTSNTLACNLHYPVEKRLSRWLLMFHDRSAGNEISLLHSHLASMLAVRRASVTDALHALEGHKAIRSTRGRIVIRDRRQLEALAGHSYGLAERRYCELIAPFGRGLETGSEPALSPQLRYG